MFAFRSHDFGDAFVSFLFQRTHKKTAEKEKPIDEDLVDSPGLSLMEKLRKRTSTEGVREPGVYDSVFWFAFFKHVFAIRILTTAKTHDVGESDFFSSAAWSSRHTENSNTPLWMVSWQKKKKKKEKSKKKWTKTPDWVEYLVLAWGPLLTVDPRKKNYDTHKRRIARLCAWFNYRKNAVHTFFWKDWFW